MLACFIPNFNLKYDDSEDINQIKCWAFCCFLVVFFWGGGYPIVKDQIDTNIFKIRSFEKKTSKLEFIRTVQNPRTNPGQNAASPG